ncbi:Cadherin-7 [Turdus rufiventris]|nr:Cadherin-7 [Turdus rufiventris]
MLLLFCAIQELGSWAMHTAVEGPGLGEPGDPALLAGGRVKRGWVWNQFFVVEEYTGTEPLYVGKILQLCSIQVNTGAQGVQLCLTGLGGTSVMQVMASDADDPTYGSSARVVYSVLEGEQHFTVDSKTGVIRTAVADLDRETQDRYEVVIRATDMAGQLGGLSGSTTVTIVVTDVNDNPPRFPQKMYQFSIVETAPVGTAIGRVKAEDSDVGENTDMTYQVKDEEGVEMFKVTTDSNTQEAVITVQKPLDYESKKVHTVVVEALNKFVDPRFVDLGTFRDQTIVRVSVLDVDEPPEFRPPSDLMEVQEDAHVGSVVGVVTALDPDTANHPVRGMGEYEAGVEVERLVVSEHSKAQLLTPAWDEMEAVGRYAIDRSTDTERIFDIDAKTGAIVTGKVLDRETAGWHNITVLAMEAAQICTSGWLTLMAGTSFGPLQFSRDNHSQVSRASLRIRILDVNDNPPELATPYEASVCEDAKPGQLIQTISVVDRDEPQSGHRFYFTLAPEATNNHHFSLLDIQDNTAAVHTQRVGFNRQEQDVYLLPILVVDSGPPALSSTGTLTIRVCGCDSNGAIQSCNSTAYVVSATLSPGALIALLVCVLILVVLVLLILTLKRHHKSHLTSEDDEDMRDNVIKYNDEGGGEQDTEAYDMSALRSLYDFSEIKAGDGGGGPGEGGPGRNPASELHALPQWVQSPDLDFSVFRDYICRKVEQADEDLSVPPYDSFQTYAFEGSDSPVPSLSSINTWSSGSEQDFSYLGGWGPRFRQLAALYAGRRGDEDSEES